MKSQNECYKEKNQNKTQKLDGQWLSQHILEEVKEKYQREIAREMVLKVVLNLQVMKILWQVNQLFSSPVITVA